MTLRKESIRVEAAGREVAARWCALAEQRLEHLSEMFETGRWRRYHSEIAFLENIQEAKRAVQTWRALATGGDVAEAAASVSAGFGWSPATMPRPSPRKQEGPIVQPKAVQNAAEPAMPVSLEPVPDVLAELVEAPISRTGVSAATASFTAPAAMPSLKAPAARLAPTAPEVRSPVVLSDVTSTAPAVRPPVSQPVAMAPLLPRLAQPADEAEAVPERVVEFTFSLDGLEAKYPLLRNAF